MIELRLFLCGGGSGEQTIEANKKLNEVINHDKPILYVPLAMNSDRYDSCYERINQELKNVDVPNIDMVVSSEELASIDLNKYSAIFIGGGNTYKLLSELKATDNFESRIKEFLKNGGIVFGSSAGAIIFGQYIDTCKYSDINEVGLKDQTGFDAFNSFSFFCHFANGSKEGNDINRKYLLELSKEEKIIALPEEDTIYYEDGRYEVIGTNPYYIFEDGNMIVFNSKIDRVKEFMKIATPIQLMEFMNCNITYGFIDKNNGKHLNNLKDFRENYRISSIDDILRTGLGTCKRAS